MAMLLTTLLGVSFQLFFRSKLKWIVVSISASIIFIAFGPYRGIALGLNLPIGLLIGAVLQFIYKNIKSLSR